MIINGNRTRSTTPKPVKKYASAISPSRKKILANWIRNLIPNLSNSLEDSIKSGQIPYRLLQISIPNFSLKGYHPSPNTSQAYNNILLINNFLFSEFHSSDLPSPSEILKKSSDTAWVLINTIFKNLALKESKKNFSKCFEWYKSILKLYDIEIAKSSFIKSSTTGVYFACVLNCYAGFKLNGISKCPNEQEAITNVSTVFKELKGKTFQPLEAMEFVGFKDEEVLGLIVFEIFKHFKLDVPNLPTRDKIIFKSKPKLVLNTEDSLISLSSMDSLEYSKSTLISKEPSENNLIYHNTPKWNKEKLLEIITDDSTGSSMHPYEVSYETVSVANSSYTKKNTEKLVQLEKSISLGERKCMFLADLRMKKEKIHEVPSLKKLRTVSKAKNDDFLCFLITPRVLKMIKPNLGNFVFAITLDAKNFSLKNESFWFEWKDFSLSIKGKMNVNEISSCESSGRLLIIRTFGGEITVQCLDEHEASCYSDGLNRLAKPKTLFSRDVSCNELILNIQ